MTRPQDVTYEDILHSLQNGATVLTGNKRLATTLRQIFDQASMAKGLKIWFSPHILPWARWLQDLWEEVTVKGHPASTEYLLTPQQELHIWENIINRSQNDPPLMQIRRTAQRVQEAWQLCHAWQLSADTPAFLDNHDSATFQRWNANFRRTCAQQAWLSHAQLPDTLRHYLLEGMLSLPAQIILFGFDELTPQQQTFIEAIKQTGCQVKWGRIAGKKAQCVRIECLNIRDEAQSMARWAHQVLKKHPLSNIGIIVPELATQRHIVCHALDTILTPQTLLPGKQAHPRPYNISLGLPLSTYPVIQTAFTLLGLLKPVHDLQNISDLLHSPFLLGWQTEGHARAMLDTHLHQTGEPSLTLNTLSFYAGQTGQAYACPILSQCLENWREIAQPFHKKQSTTQWREHFDTLLNTLGWTKGRPLSSEEYQAVEAWQVLLLHFSLLDTVSPAISASSAISCLQNMAHEQTFQPQTNAAPIQVMGTLEAIEQQFDYLWILGLHDAAWPAQAHPNPFLPLTLQRTRELPHCSAIRELNICKHITNRLLGSAAEIIVSSAKKQGDEMLRPSPLIRNIKRINQNDLSLWRGKTWQALQQHTQGNTTLIHDPAPPIPCKSIQGGSNIFKQQAACPFRAFAEYRLEATAPQKTTIGLNAMTRGILVHRIMETVWIQLKSQQTLLNTDKKHLDALVYQCVEKALTEIRPRYPQSLRGRFYSIEKQRLHRQILLWFTIEKQRPPFDIAELETPYDINIGGVQIRIKIDRIDSLADDRKMLIDYKTGNVSPSDWSGNRPNDPQLPLYSMALDIREKDIAGLVFAQISAGDIHFNGITADANMLPDVKPSEKVFKDKTWKETLSEWRSVLIQLGKDFCHGHAAVDPKSYPSTCEYCELTALCRIDELRHSSALIHSHDCKEPV